MNKSWLSFVAIMSSLVLTAFVRASKTGTFRRRPFGAHHRGKRDGFGRLVGIIQARQVLRARQRVTYACAALFVSTSLPWQVAYNVFTIVVQVPLDIIDTHGLYHSGCNLGACGWSIVHEAFTEVARFLASNVRRLVLDLQLIELRYK